MTKGVPSLLLALLFGVGSQAYGYEVRRLALASVAGRPADGAIESSLGVIAGGMAGASSRCNLGLRATTGFFSRLGHADVPVVLVLRRDPLNREFPRLEWSGVADRFRVYRADAPEAVLDPSNAVRMVRSCDTTDDQNFGNVPAFYQVVPLP